MTRMLTTIVKAVCSPTGRLGYALGFLTCASLMGYAFYLQYVEFEEPCPLCYMQRVAMVAVGLVFLLATLWNPKRVGRIVIALLNTLFAGAGAAIAIKHLWIQSLPPDQVPQCGPGLSYMLDTMGFAPAIAKALQGSGECADASWRFLSLTIPAWTLICFILFIIGSWVLARRDTSKKYF